ncbi:MAG: PAS domain-containing protein [Bacteroidales bacterium]|nr:PAS domain-containing protein [Bacteroidales bacterium]
MIDLKTLSAAFDAISDPVFIVCKDRKMLMANSQAKKLFSIPADLPIEEKACEQVINCKQYGIEKCCCNQTTDSREQKIEIGGQKFLLKSMGLINKKGNVEGSINIFENITKLEQVESKLSVSEKKFKDLFEQMTGGLAIHRMLYDETGTATDYVFLNVNPAFEQLTGLKKADILNKRLLEVMPQTESEWIKKYDLVLKPGAPCIMKISLIP